jgi:hypothetical protein
MATTPLAIYRGAATTNTATTLNTVPSGKTWIITNIVVTNTSASLQSYTLGLDGVSIANTVSISANDSVVIDMKQVLAASKTVTGGASATSVTFHISGVELG